MKDRQVNWPVVILIIVIAWMALGGKFSILQPTPATKATAATFVYEKDQHIVPGPVLAALNQLNRERGIIATLFEQDTKDGTGDVPEQYKPALAAAKEAGLPALVVQAGKDVLRTVKDPKTEDEVLKAVLP